MLYKQEFIYIERINKVTVAIEGGYYEEENI